jgi:hypothetical protein
VGKASFNQTQIEENARSVIDAVVKARPHSVKGTYIHTLHSVGNNEPACASGHEGICHLDFLFNKQPANNLP